jgi:hypothetical protein
VAIRSRELTSYPPASLNVRFERITAVGRVYRSGLAGCATWWESSSPMSCCAGPSWVHHPDPCFGCERAGYISERVPQTMLADSIPIYFGDVEELSAHVNLARVVVSASMMGIRWSWSDCLQFFLLTPLVCAYAAGAIVYCVFSTRRWPVASVRLAVVRQTERNVIVNAGVPGLHTSAHAGPPCEHRRLQARPAGAPY